MKIRDPDAVVAAIQELGECLLIVEGRRDALALYTLGLYNILPINGKPLIAVVQEAAALREVHRYPDIIILTDFDKKGREIAARLSRLLRAHRIHPNQRIRSRIMKFGFNKIEDIRMDSIFRRKERSDVHVKVSTNFNKVRDKGVDKGERRSREA